MTARLSQIVKTASAMGFAHYSTARKIAPAPPVRFSNAVPYRFVVFTIRGGQKRETVPYASRSSTPFPTDTLRVADSQSGTRSRLMPAATPGDAYCYEGKIPLPQCFPPSRPNPCGLARLPGYKHLQHGILPAVNPLQAASSLTAHSPQIIRSDCSFDCIDALFFGHSCLRYHLTFILLYALKKNKKSAKIVRLMVSVKVRRLTLSASRNLDRHQHRTEKAVLFLFLFFPVFLFLFFRKFFKCLFS